MKSCTQSLVLVVHHHTQRAFQEVSSRDFSHILFPIFINDLYDEIERTLIKLVYDKQREVCRHFGELGPEFKIILKKNGEMVQNQQD